MHTNLTQVLSHIAESAELREKPTIAHARQWHRGIMAGLTVPDPRYVGSFRGEPGLEQAEVKVLGRFGAPSAEVGAELERFEARLQRLVATLDALIPSGKLPNADQFAAVLDLCAWAHADWVRIHPFANGNGRVARLWANCLAMRYGLPPFVRLRPRPNTSYGEAGGRAMEGDWRPTAAVFRRLFQEFLDTV